jgi:hypothetical protein
MLRNFTQTNFKQQRVACSHLCFKKSSCLGYVFINPRALGPHRFHRRSPPEIPHCFPQKFDPGRPLFSAKPRPDNNQERPARIRVGGRQIYRLQTLPAYLVMEVQKPCQTTPPETFPDATSFAGAKTNLQKRPCLASDQN